MKKRIISLFLVAALMLTLSFSAFASEDSKINGIINRINEIPSAERQSYITLLVPLFMVDSGIDTIIGFVNNYSEGKDDESFINEYIGKLLNYTEKEVLVNFLKTFKCTDLEGRQNLLTVLRNKVPLEMSQNTEESINFLLSVFYMKYPLVEKILKEDGYTINVLANLLNCAFKINKQNPFYLYDKNSKEFSAGIIDEKLKADIEKIWENYSVTEEGLVKTDAQAENKRPIKLDTILGSAADKLNSVLSAEERDKTAAGLAEAGLVKITDGIISGGASGGKPVKITAEQKGKTVVYYTEMKLPVLYKVEGESLIPVKYSIAENGKLTAKIEAEGEYIIKETEPKFTDCDGWAKDYIEILAARQIINGKAENLFMPKDKITREEFVKLVVELLDLEKTKAASIFTDVDENAWYAPFVNTAYENEIIKGISENQFGVGASIKRQDMAKIINTVLKSLGITSQKATEEAFSDFEKIADYAKEHVLSIYSMGIISGDENKNFNPDSFATRAEAAKMIYGMLKEIVQSN